MTTDTAPASASRTAEPRHAVFHPLRVAGVERLTDDAVTVVFEVPESLREAYRFTQGQHVTVRWSGDGSDVRRNYSICSSATSGVLRIAVKRLPGGVFSSYACTELAVGDVLDVMTPTGRFHTPLDPAQAKHYAAVVAGSGITPVLSIVQTALEVEPSSRCTLIYGNGTMADVMFLEELADLKNRFPDRFAWYPVFSREPQEVDLFSGRIDGPRLSRFLDALLPPDDVDEWFLCGPFEMTQQAAETLRARGVDPHHVHRELFHVEEAPPRRRAVTDAGPGQVGTSRVTVILDGRSTTFDLATDGVPVLEAALAVRGDTPYACKGGVCGTCRARLVEGKVEMDRNYALESDELERGYVLTCQSHPVGPTVVLDYDA